MANQVLFVSETKLKAWTSVQDNVNPKDLTPYMYMTQDIRMQEMVGTNFYNALKDQVIANTVTTVNRNLLDEFIVPYLLPAMIYDMLPWFQFRMWNKGVLAGASDNTNAVPGTLKDIEILRNDILHNVNFYKERLRRELMINQSLYPDYLLNTPQQNIMPAVRPNYTNAFGLPNSRSKTMNQQYQSDINGFSGYYGGYYYENGVCRDCPNY
jgi:hypothetical protein